MPRYRATVEFDADDQDDAEAQLREIDSNRERNLIVDDLDETEETE